MQCRSKPPQSAARLQLQISQKLIGLFPAICCWGTAWEARTNEICPANFFVARVYPLQFGIRAAGARGSSRNDLELPPSTRRRAGNPGLHAQPNCARAGRRDGLKGRAYVLDHGVLGPFSSRVASSKSERAAENIAYGHDSFPKTLGQWIDSSEHRRNLLMHGASKVGVASAKSATTGRTYWAMVIAGGYERSRPPLRPAKPTTSRRAERTCRMKILGLCL